MRSTESKSLTAVVHVRRGKRRRRQTRGDAAAAATWLRQLGGPALQRYEAQPARRAG